VKQIERLFPLAVASPREAWTLVVGWLLANRGGAFQHLSNDEFFRFVDAAAEGMPPEFRDKYADLRRQVWELIRNESKMH